MLSRRFIKNKKEEFFFAFSTPLPQILVEPKIFVIIEKEIAPGIEKKLISRKVKSFKIIIIIKYKVQIKKAIINLHLPSLSDPNIFLLKNLYVKKLVSSVRVGQLTLKFYSFRFGFL